MRLRQIDVCDEDENCQDIGSEGQRVRSGGGAPEDEPAEAAKEGRGDDEWEEELPRTSSPVAYTGRFQS